MKPIAGSTRGPTAGANRFAVRAVVAACGLALLVGGAEISLRLRFPRDGYIVGNDLYEPDPDAGYRLRPGAWAGGIRINSLGYADPEIARAKPAGGFRVLVTGDSFTFPDTYTDSYVKQLEQRLRRVHPSETIEVVNAGVNGYGMAQELARYRHRDRLLAPDIVVVGLFVGNDVADAIASQDVTVFAGEIVNRAELERVRGRWLGLYPYVRVLAARSWLVTYLRGAIERPDPHRGYRPDALAFATYSSGRASWSDTRAKVLEAAGWLTGPLGPAAERFIHELERRLPQTPPEMEALADVRAAAADVYGDLLSASLGVTHPEPADHIEEWAPFYLFEPATFAPWNEMLGASVRQAEEFAKDVYADGARFLVLLIPDRLQVGQALLAQLCKRTSRDCTALDLDAPQRFLTAHYGELGIEYLDLLPRFRDEERRAPLYLEHNPHWNHRGKRIAAEALFQRIEEEGWLH